jgi:hypothetical protein
VNRRERIAQVFGSACHLFKIAPADATH